MPPVRGDEADGRRAAKYRMTERELLRKLGA